MKRPIRRVLSLQQDTWVPQQAVMIQEWTPIPAASGPSCRHRSHRGSLGFSPHFSTASMDLLVLCCAQ